jgi:hypothetical protein
MKHPTPVGSNKTHMAFIGQTTEFTMKHLLLAASLTVPSLAHASFDYHLSEYLKCSQEAVLQVLDKSEAISCMDHYLRVKLHFVDVTYEEYQEMSSLERTDANRIGYLRFKEWELQQFGQ